MSAKVPKFTVPSWLAPHVAVVRTWPVVARPHPRCIVTACSRTAFSLGLCHTHYDNLRVRALRESGSMAVWVAEHPDAVVNAPAVRSPEAICWVAACKRTASANGLCHAHREMARRRFRFAEAAQPAPGRPSLRETTHNAEETTP
ncbi:hypothetical protein [Microbacterium lacticum]|uniref:Uncharacterized protein n=1 Tax=Microbacterium lacticum TaxID=33885 RepID=A0A4Y3UL26_9MICO|nr:hypothetical protein [Microbacterium lacticum]TQN00746.1 hypothetical protein FHX68_0864 [Microbacterium lacticum]GEB94170.1 hypothetical protein MLA01_03890 [Microbacterium lacticum]GGN13841.1 hypothetical protein GCM10009724_04040 [Microbacterium lacticum]